MVEGGCVVAKVVCVVARGHAWLLGVCMVAGGACVVVGGAYIGYDEIWSMSGRYTSYWNAFLFFIDSWRLNEDIKINITIKVFVRLKTEMVNKTMWFKQKCIQKSTENFPHLV